MYKLSSFMRRKSRIVLKTPNIRPVTDIGHGYPPSPNCDCHCDQVVDGLSAVHPSETALLNHICQLSTHYLTFSSFITHYGHSPAPVSEVDDTYGFYLQSLAHGLDLILMPYRSCLVTLEKELLADPHLTLTHIQTALEK
ncbi:hypothetical protein CAPTEDRAFT_196523, partial [Capitella teleta]